MKDILVENILISKVFSAKIYLLWCKNHFPSAMFTLYSTTTYYYNNNCSFDLILAR